MDRPARLERILRLSEADATQTALFQQAAAASQGLGVTEMRALSILLRDGPRTAGALSRSLHLTTGAVTGLVDRLARRGLVRRQADPADRRKVVIAVEHDGLAEAESLYRGIGQAFAALYASYSDDELAFLERHLAASIAITEREAARLHQAE